MLAFEHLRRNSHGAVAVIAMLVLSACALDLPRADGTPNGPMGRDQDRMDPPPAPDGLFEPAMARYWAWDMPRGRAADLPQIIPMVRVIIHDLDGRAAADKVCSLIRQRGLRSGEVCILLQGFGEGGGDPRGKDYHVRGRTPLFMHWDDGLSRSAAPKWWYTPWMTHGIEQTGAWMRAFIGRYRAHQLQDARIPDPSRFHFDSEHFARVEETPRGALQVFHAMRNDPRWSTELIPGQKDPLATLYAAAGSPSYNPTLPWFKGPNRAWSIWYQQICLEAVEAAMNEVAYDPIRDAWPSCKSSNYNTSTTFDGQQNRFDVDGLNPWFRFAHRGYADMQAPVCYRPVAAPTATRPLLAGIDSLDVFCNRIVDMSQSFGGMPMTEIVPWIELPGNVRVVRNHRFEQTDAQSYSEIRTLGELGIREFIVWSNPDTGADPDNWNTLADIVQGSVPSSVDASTRR